jgi:hypothetical protein
MNGHHIFNASAVSANAFYGVGDTHVGGDLTVTGSSDLGSVDIDSLTGDYTGRISGVWETGAGQHFSNVYRMTFNKNGGFYLTGDGVDSDGNRRVIVNYDGNRLGQSATFYIPTPSKEWALTHNFSTSDLHTTVRDTDFRGLTAGVTDTSNQNKVYFYFTDAQAGYATLSTGALGTLDYSFTFDVAAGENTKTTQILRFHGEQFYLSGSTNEGVSINSRVDDTPVNAEILRPISSNWAFDHVAAADPHTGYRLESADHTHQSTGAQAGKIDHGAALDGLSDNDHPQYLLVTDIDDTPVDAETSQPISSNWAYDHENDADQHPEYILADGTRAFTGKVVGVAPTADLHLSTKKYVDDSVGDSLVGPGFYGVIFKESESGGAVMLDNTLIVDSDAFYLRGNSTGKPVLGLQAAAGGTGSVQIADGDGGFTSVAPHAQTTYSLRSNGEGVAPSFQLPAATGNNFATQININGNAVGVNPQAAGKIFTANGTSAIPTWEWPAAQGPGFYGIIVSDGTNVHKTDKIAFDSESFYLSHGSNDSAVVNLHGLPNNITVQAEQTGNGILTPDEFTWITKKSKTAILPDGSRTVFAGLGDITFATHPADWIYRNDSPTSAHHELKFSILDRATVDTEAVRHTAIKSEIQMLLHVPDPYPLHLGAEEIHFRDSAQGVAVQRATDGVLRGGIGSGGLWMDNEIKTNSGFYGPIFHVGGSAIGDETVLNGNTKDVTWNWTESNNYFLNLKRPTTIHTPTGLQSAQTVNLVTKNDGFYNISWSSKYIFSGGGQLSPTLAEGAVDLWSMIYHPSLDKIVVARLDNCFY